MVAPGRAATTGAGAVRAAQESGPPASMPPGDHHLGIPPADRHPEHRLHPGDGARARDHDLARPARRRDRARRRDDRRQLRRAAHVGDGRGRPAARPPRTTSPARSGARSRSGSAPRRPPPPGRAGSRSRRSRARELGVAEQPPGSNDAPRIAEYRTATAGAAARPALVRVLHLLGRRQGRRAHRPRRPGARIRAHGQAVGRADRPLHPGRQRRRPRWAIWSSSTAAATGCSTTSAWSPAPRRTAASRPSRATPATRCPRAATARADTPGLVRLVAPGT